VLATFYVTTTLLSWTHGQAKYQEPHTSEQTDYVMALRKTLGTCAANRGDTVSGHGSRMVWVGSREYRALGDMRQEWYPDDVKRIPDDLSWLDDFAVAKWLMDDGCRQRFVKQADRISFSTHSFSEPDIRRLGDRLADLYGVSYHLCQDSGRGLTLVVNSGRKQQIRKLWAAVAPFIHPCMRYKLPEEFHDTPYVEPTPGYERVIPLPAKVLSVTPVEPIKRNFPHGRTGFDVTTTTHNYLARGVLVHNSLGIIYPTTKSTHAMSTRGSFVSEQAVHATEVWRRRYARAFTPPAGVTVLVEIVYPDNRIVLDYGDRDQLVLLGGVDIATGHSVEVTGWPGPVAERFAYATLAEALAAPPRAGAEGLVLHVPRTDERIKLKQADYVTLHRLIFGLTTRRVWERLAVAAARADTPGAPVTEIARVLRLDPVEAAAMLEAGPAWWDDVRRTLPEEFTGWLDDTAAQLRAQVEAVLAATADRVAALAGLARRDAAAALASDPAQARGLAFAALDGKPLVARAWSAIRPEHERPLLQHGEDVA
jgi:RNA ligase